MMDKPCSRDGCARSAFARGMCKNHYVYWYEKMRRQGRQPTRPPSIRQVIAPATPGTSNQIAERLGVTIWALRRNIKKMRDAGEMFVAGWEPPEKMGDQWKAVYAMGAGPDVELCAVWRDVHARMSFRARKSASDKRIRQRAKLAQGPNFAALLAPLGA